MSGFKRGEVVVLPGISRSQSKTWFWPNFHLKIQHMDEETEHKLRTGTPVSDPDRTKDLYFVEAAKHFGVPIDEVTPEQRRQMKDVLFGQVYGQSSEATSDEYKLARQRAIANVWRIVYGTPDEPVED